MGRDTLGRFGQVHDAALSAQLGRSGLTPGQIAGQLGASPQTVRRHLHAAGIPVRHPAERHGALCECGTHVKGYGSDLYRRVWERMSRWESDPLDMVGVAWAAGLFEGEGSFVANGHAQAAYPRAQLSMCDRDVVDRFARVIGIHHRMSRPDRPTVTGKPVYRWCISGGPGVGAFAVLIWPWLGSRRREKAIELLRKWREAKAGDIGHETDHGIIENPDEFPALPEPVREPAREPVPVAEPVPA